MTKGGQKGVLPKTGGMEEEGREAALLNPG